MMDRVPGGGDVSLLEADEPYDTVRHAIEQPPTHVSVAPLSVLDVAADLIERLGPMETYKLQKLCYYAQAQHVAKFNTRLFAERVEAWRNGPVVRELYACHAGKWQINHVPAIDPASVSQQPAAVETLDYVVKQYGDFTGGQLSEMTHREQPWVDARAGLKPSDAGQVEIPVEVLRDYYRSFFDVEPVDADS